MSNINIAKAVVTFLIISTCCFAKAQTIKVPLVELDKLFNKLRIDTSISFTASYYTADDDSANIVLYDTLIGNIKLYKNNFYGDFGTVKRISNNYFSMVLDTIAKDMYVDYAQDNVGELINLKIADRDYYNSYVDSVYFSNPTTKDEIVIGFNNNSPFYYYKIKFNTTVLSLISIEYAVKKDILDYTPPPAPFAPPSGGGNPTPSGPSTRVKIVFSNYSNIVLNLNTFDLSPYFTNARSGLAPTATNSNYQVINLTK